MLVFSRKKNEGAKVTMGDVLVEVVVVEIRANTVRLGFIAPPEVVIHRDEVMEAIAREGRRKAPSAPAEDLTGLKESA